METGRDYNPFTCHKCKEEKDPSFGYHRCEACEKYFCLECHNKKNNLCDPCIDQVEKDWQQFDDEKDRIERSK